MMTRNLPRFDLATETNLRSLERIAEQHGGDGTFEEIDALIISTIRLIERLPDKLQGEFSLHSFYVSGSHERGPGERRCALWRRLAEGLNRSLDTVAAGAHSGDALDLGIRSKTRGEIIDDICTQLNDALSRRGDLGPLVDRLVKESAGTPASRDARELRRHLDMKRIPDLERWRSELYFLVGHAAEVAGGLHHLP